MKHLFTQFVGHNLPKVFLLLAVLCLTMGQQAKAQEVGDIFYSKLNGINKDIEFIVTDAENLECCMQSVPSTAYTNVDVVIPATIKNLMNSSGYNIAEADQKEFKITAIGKSNANTGLFPKGFKSLTLSEGLKIIHPYAFSPTNMNSYSGTPTPLVIPSTVEELGAYAFRKCVMFSSVDLSKSKVKKIGNNCFAGCENLKSVDLNNGVLEEIGECAFEKCALASVTIPASVKLIRGAAFRSCYDWDTSKNSLKKVTFEGDQAHFYDDSDSSNKGYCFVNDNGTQPDIENVPYYMGYHFTDANGYNNLYQNIDFVYKPTKAWQTFSTLLNMEFETEAYTDGLRVYEITGIDATNKCVTLTENTPEAGKLLLYGNKCYVLYGTPGTTYHMGRENTGIQTKQSTYLLGDGTVNALTGMSSFEVAPKVTKEGVEYTNMILKDGKFVKVSGTAALPAGKAYLSVKTSEIETLINGSAPQLSLSLGGEGSGTTAIETIETINLDGTRSYYDLQGRRLDGPQRGINIVNGKKVVIK